LRTISASGERFGPAVRRPLEPGPPWWRSMPPRPSRSRFHGSLPAIWRPACLGSAFTWTEIHVTPLNPAARHTSALVCPVAAELAAAGWKLQAVSTDNGSEFRSQRFPRSVHATGAEQRFIRAGRPRTNGCLERVQRTILEECWRP